MESFDVSVIVSCRNEESNIENCLQAIKNQEYPKDKIEIIVVDNNSKDLTKEIAFRYTKKIYNFGPERSAQRNFGVKYSSGEYILYLDADMMLSENVIRECLTECRQANYIALYIPERIVGRGLWIRIRDFERSFYNASCIDAVRFVRKDKLLEIGGFDENLTGPEDWDFNRRIKQCGRVGIITAPVYHNEGLFRLRRYLEKKKYYSKTFKNYVDKWGREDKLVRQQLGFFYRYFGVFFEKGKWRRFLSHPLELVLLYFLKFMVGINYLQSENG